MKSGEIWWRHLRQEDWLLVVLQYEEELHNYVTKNLIFRVLYLVLMRNHLKIILERAYLMKSGGSWWRHLRQGDWLLYRVITVYLVSCPAAVIIGNTRLS